MEVGRDIDADTFVVLAWILIFGGGLLAVGLPYAGSWCIERFDAWLSTTPQQTGTLLGAAKIAIRVLLLSAVFVAAWVALDQFGPLWLVVR